MLLDDGGEIRNSGSTVFLPKATVMGGTFHFSQTSAPPVEEARAVPFYVGSPELVQNTGNEEHTSGKRADLPLTV